MNLSARREVPPAGWPRLESLVAARMLSALSPALSVPKGAEDSPENSALYRLASPGFRLGSRDSSQRGNGLWRRFWRFLLALFLGIHFVYITGTSLLIIAYRFVNPSVTVLMVYRSWIDHWKLEKPRALSLQNTPGYVRRMLISVEDGNFYKHHGVDIEAVKRAYEINKRLGRPLYGGSTLTMQMARTLFLVPEKSYVRKYFELIAALELELFLPKDRILELYFNYAEWGKGVFGIEAAARHYYGRGLSALSRPEAAKLVALLSSPIKYTPSTLLNKAILRERYYYLIGRYTSPPPTTAEPDTDDAVQNAPAAEGSEPVQVWHSAPGEGSEAVPQSSDVVADQSEKEAAADGTLPASSGGGTGDSPQSGSDTGSADGGSGN